MKKLLLGIVLTLITLTTFGGTRINGIVRTLYYMSPNDTVSVSDNLSTNTPRVRVLFDADFKFLDSSSTNLFRITKAGHYILQGYDGKGSALYTAFNIKTIALPAPVVTGLFAYCNNTEDTFFVSMAQPYTFNNYDTATMQWYFNNGAATNSWPIAWQFPAAYVGNFKFSIRDKSGNLFKSATTITSCGNRFPIPVPAYDIIDALNNGYKCYDVYGRETVPAIGNFYILTKDNTYKKVLIIQ